MERVAHGIAEGAKRQVKVMRDAIAPSGSRLPFTEQLSQPDALNFWRLHRYDATGKHVLDTMNPNDIMELDLALAQRNQGGMQIDNSSH
jgi:hypothetical protein